MDLQRLNKPLLVVASAAIPLGWIAQAAGIGGDDPTAPNEPGTSRDRSPDPRFGGDTWKSCLPMARLATTYASSDVSYTVSMPFSGCTSRRKTKLISP